MAPLVFASGKGANTTFSAEERAKINGKYEANMKIMETLTTPFARACPAIMSASPRSFDEA